MRHIKTFGELNEAEKIAKRGNKYYLEVYLKKSTYDTLTKIAAENNKSFKKMCELIIMESVKSDEKLKPVVNETGVTKRVELHFTEDEMDMIEGRARDEDRSIKNLGEVILRDRANK